MSSWIHLFHQHKAKKIGLSLGLNQNQVYFFKKKEMLNFQKKQPHDSISLREKRAIKYMLIITKENGLGHIQRTI